MLPTSEPMKGKRDRLILCHCPHLFYMNLFRLWLLLVCLQSLTSLPAQDEVGRLCMVWYNVENLFYPQNDSLSGDDEFTPEGVRHWTWFRYRAKLTALAKVIIAAGRGEAPEVVGLCEVEDARVLEELVAHPILAPYQYSFLHKDGPDHRGMEVACLIRPERSGPLQWECKSFKFPVVATRDIMHIFFRWGTDSLDLFLVHLVSRYGGAGATAEIRRIQTEQLLHCMDSVHALRQEGILMAAGDFNAEFMAYSMEPVRNARFGPDSLIPLIPAAGKGSYKYRGLWSPIDQFLVSSSLQLSRVSCTTLQLLPLMTKDLKFGGLKPKRTYEGYLYRGGISDHLPLVVNLYPSCSSVPDGQ